VGNDDNGDDDNDDDNDDNDDMIYNHHNVND
jgi:hypothetical protein